MNKYIKNQVKTFFSSPFFSTWAWFFVTPITSVAEIQREIKKVQSHRDENQYCHSTRSIQRGGITKSNLYLRKSESSIS